MRWLATERALLKIPNEAILKVFALSSFVTFTSGIGLAVEWIFHGKYHVGLEWIISYALFLICLPTLILIGLLRVLMAISSDSVEAKEPDASKAQETETNRCRSLAVVVDLDEKNNKEEKIPRIKRAVSFPSHRQIRSCRTR